MPTAVGAVGFAARYVSATTDALIGGDLYEVATSPYGVRMVVGDARGKGLDAVQLAATVTGMFRHSAFHRPTLVEVAADLDDIVSAMSGEEDFVTALLAEFHEDGTVLMVNCGHYPPMRVDPDGHASLDTGEVCLPLGLDLGRRLLRPVQSTATWEVGSRLLFFTDGLVEERDAAGAFFPLDAHADLMATGPLEEALDGLVHELLRHSDSGLHDDMAMVLAERPV
jgi:sigma-B regulation protein RsbU (phosphoserine phosphatase)